MKTIVQIVKIRNTEESMVAEWAIRCGFLVLSGSKGTSEFR
jgi:hypothetical protein